MALSEEEKQKIASEERYRAEQRRKAEKKKTSPAAWGCLILILLFVLIVFLGAASDGDNNENEGIKEIAQPVLNKEVVFDVPSLLKMRLSQVENMVGPPVNENPNPTKEALSTGVADWTRVYDSSGYSIDVTYNITGEEVTRIFLSKGNYDTPLEETWVGKNQGAELLDVGKLSKDASDYYVRFYWPAQDKSMYTGLEVQKRPFIGYKGDQLCSGYPEC